MNSRSHLGVGVLKVLVEEKNNHCYLCGRYLELPKDLPCNHTFCRACLQQFCLSNALEDRFPCPECNITIKIPDPNIPIIEWADTIPTNHETEKRLQAARQIESERKRKYCTLCRVKWKKIHASKYCKACQEYFCDECGNQHWLLRKSKQHRVWLLEDLEELEKDPLLRSYLDLIFNTKLIQKKKLIKDGEEENNDSENCLISGATFLPGGELVLADKNNQKLKYFDKHHRFVSSISIQCHDVLACNRNFIIVSSPLLNKLSIFGIHANNIDFLTDLELDASCYGLCHTDNGHGNKFAVTLSSRPVRVVLFSGTKQTKSIELSAGEITMLCPSYIAYIKTEMTYVLLDDTHACVKCFNNDGSIVWEKKISNCKGLDVFDNHILIGRSDRKTVDMVNVNGKILKSVVTDEDDVSNVNCICTDHFQHTGNTIRLFVGDNTNLARVFLLEDPLKDNDLRVFINRQNTASSDFDVSDLGKRTNTQTRACTIL
ncbi:hypothetical protein ACF0H5_010457 [Mactra antiquata]